MFCDCYNGDPNLRLREVVPLHVLAFAVAWSRDLPSCGFIGNSDELCVNWHSLPPAVTLCAGKGKIARSLCGWSTRKRTSLKCSRCGCCSVVSCLLLPDAFVPIYTLQEDYEDVKEVDGQVAHDSWNTSSEFGV